VDERSVEAVARRFHGPGPVRAEHFERGNVHDTWFVSSGEARSVLQRLNDHVFGDCVQMVDNVLRVSAHVERRLGRSLPVRRTLDGAVLVYDGEGRPWRAFERVPHASSHRVVTSAEQAREIGRALGRFLAAIQNLPGPPLKEPIPGFKDFEQRRADFELMVDVDVAGRASTCALEIDGVRRYHRLVDRFIAALDRGDLPTRLVHNDAKADNVLLDDGTGEAVCVVDLDTVAPGTVLYDVGDLLRSATVTSPEDAVSVSVRDDLLEAALGGYLTGADGVVSPGERTLIPLAGPLMAYEAALRFLTDHLGGDTYFRVTRPLHNLVRARAQLQVLDALTTAGGRVADVVERATAP
jgi:aminoglycoside phosphotransferase (APT) family kinase protein